MRDQPDVPEQAIMANLRHVQEKVGFLGTLYDEGRKQEALTLCCVYIEGFAQRIYSKSSDRKSQYLFVRVLLDHGGEEILRLVDPPTLMKKLNLGEPPEALARISSASPVELLTIESVHNLLEDEDQKKLTWKATIAALVYSELRSPLAHDRPPSSHGLWLSDTVFQGEPIGRISFDVIYPALCRIAEHWKVLFVSNPPRPRRGHD